MPNGAARIWLAVPVISRETALGAVCVYWDQTHTPDEREIRLLSALARQAIAAVGLSTRD